MRTVNFNFDRSDLDALMDNTDSEKVTSALSYLATWNFTYTIVDVYFIPSTNEITAVYRDETGARKYVIGAVWHTDHFGFHS